MLPKFPSFPSATPAPSKASKPSTKAPRAAKPSVDKSQLITTMLVAIASFTLGRVFQGMPISRTSSPRARDRSSDDHTFENAVNIPHLDADSPARFSDDDEERQAYIAERARAYDLQLKHELMEIELSASSAGLRMVDRTGFGDDPYAAYAAGVGADDDSFMSSSALDRSYGDVTQSPGLSIPYVPITP